MQGCHFCSNFKVLPLQHFDVVLGYDWLEEFSPMKVHLAEKWIAIPYATGTMVLKGILSKLCPSAVVQLFHLSEQDLNLEDDEPSKLRISCLVRLRSRWILLLIFFL
jgi:hypothetical protein